VAVSVDRELSFRYCLRLARRHPENFFIGSLFLPRSKRRHLAAVYAYARLADDIADGDLATAEKLAALDCWEAQLDSCLRGVAIHPVFVALGETIRECDLPVDPLRRPQGGRRGAASESRLGRGRRGPALRRVGRRTFHLSARPRRPPDRAQAAPLSEPSSV